MPVRWEWQHGGRGRRETLGACGRAVAGIIVLVMVGCASRSRASESGRTAPAAPSHTGATSGPTVSGGLAMTTPTPSGTATASQFSAAQPKPSSGPLPSPPVSRPSGGPVTVQAGPSDNGRQLMLQVSQRLQVQLPDGWTAPQAAVAGEGAALMPLRRDAAQGYPRPGPAWALFTALRKGTATVTAHADPTCAHSTPRCAPPDQTFSLTVVAVPPIGQRAGPRPLPPGI